MYLQSAEFRKMKISDKDVLGIRISAKAALITFTEIITSALSSCSYNISCHDPHFIAQSPDATVMAVRMALLLSHGQATIERGFSVNEEVVIENQQTKSLIARHLIKDHIIQAGGILQVSITKQIMISVRSARSRYLADKKECEVKERAQMKRKTELDAIEELRMKTKRLISDIDALHISVKKYAEKCETTGDLTYIAKSNSLRRTADEKEEELKQIFMRMRLPNVLTTDNSSEFRNKLNAAMLKKLGIRHSFITPYHPQSNGLDERYNQTLQSMLSKAVMGHKEMWDEFIDSAVFAYNTSTHESTTYSPFEVMFGRKARLPVEADLRPIPSNYDSRLAHAPNTSNQMAKVAKERQEILKDVKRNILAAQAKQKQHYDAKHTRAKLFDVGVQVLKKDFLRKKRKGGKLDPRSSVANPSDCVKRVNGAHLKAFHSQSIHTQSLRSFLTPSLESVFIPTFQSAFAHSLHQSTPQHTAFQSVYTTAFQSVYTTAFQSVYTTAFQSVYTTAFHQFLPKSPHQSSSHLSKVISSTISSASGCPSNIIQVPLSCDDNETECSGACVLHYKAAEDDEEFDETSLRLKEGEYALSKDITVCLWLEYRSLNGRTPLRDVSGGDFVIINEELHGEFDEFRSKVYAYVDKEYSIVELLQVAMDIVGPLPRTKSGNRYILVMSDYATRYPEAVPVKAIDAEHIAEELVKIFARVGIPEEILTDQGSNFTSQLLAEMYQLLHVHPIQTTPYHPQTDGLVERFNKTLKEMLRKDKLATMAEMVKGTLERAQQKQKLWYDQNARQRELKPGDLVLVLLPTSSSSLTAQWKGPYPVLHKASSVNYVVDMHDTRKRERTFHINMLKKWNTPTYGNYWADVDDEESSEDDIPEWRGSEKGEPTVGDQLSAVQKSQLNKVDGTPSDYHRDKASQTTTIPVTSRLPRPGRKGDKGDARAGVIEPSSSEWASPIVLVGKKDGTLRFCIDYRRLNSESLADAYPMPRIDDLIDRLGKARYISTLDLTRGYWQVPMAKASRHLTAFTTPFGLFQFRVMPFGLQGAPATFQRLMDKVLQGLEDYAAAYIDNLVIHSTTWEEHLTQIQTVFQRLRLVGLTSAKPQKCQLRCVYLGHVVGSGLVQPERSKMQGVESFPTPTTKKQVRCFLGMTGYYRKFIPDYASIAAPLTDLTKNAAPNQVVWTDRCEGSFQKLKSLLCREPALHSPDFTKEFVLQTDASDVGVGAVLSQLDEEGADHPVAYYSRKLLAREQKYATIEKECLAIKLATQAFRVYLLGRPFIIQTDHRALEWLDRLRENNAKLSRWSIALQPFKFQVRHRPGKDNGNADCLSRLPTE
eukprot:Em0008g1293a